MTSVHKNTKNRLKASDSHKYINIIRPMFTKKFPLISPSLVLSKRLHLDQGHWFSEDTDWYITLNTSKMCIGIIQTNWLSGSSCCLYYTKLEIIPKPINYIDNNWTARGQNNTVIFSVTKCLLTNLVDLQATTGKSLMLTQKLLWNSIKYNFTLK